MKNPKEKKVPGLKHTDEDEDELFFQLDANDKLHLKEENTETNITNIFIKTIVPCLCCALQARQSEADAREV